MVLSLVKDIHPPVTSTPLAEACPCCGRKEFTVPPTIGFDYWKGVIYTSTARVNLSKLEADLFQTFLEAWPEIIDQTTIETKLYGKQFHEKKIKADRSSMHFVLRKLRKKIKPLDLDIVNTPNKGWYLSK